MRRLSVIANWTIFAEIQNLNLLRLPELDKEA
jgi:hypothetical protein